MSNFGASANSLTIRLSLSTRLKSAQTHKLKSSILKSHRLGTRSDGCTQLVINVIIRQLELQLQTPTTFLGLRNRVFREAPRFNPL